MSQVDQQLATQVEEKEEVKEFYGRFGSESAQRADSQPGLIKESLAILYQEIVKQAGADEASIARRIQSLKGEVQSLENKREEHLSEMANLEEKILDTEKQIEGIETEQGNPDFIPFVVGAFITILLTFYLWAFYSASGYAAYNGIPQGSTGFGGIFTGLSEAFSEGGTLTIIVVLFPTVFLGLGFLIHDGLEKKRYGFISILLTFTFLFDAMIGGFIAKSLHDIGVNNGDISEEWKNSMILSDLNFYFVLASGFVCYVMWGFLLNYTLNKWTEIQPPARIRKLKDQILEWKKLLKKCEGDIIGLESQIESKGKDIIAYLNGQVDIDIPTLKANIGHFMGGWSAYTVLMKGKGAQPLLLAADQEKERWLEEKVASLSLSVVSTGKYSVTHPVSVN